MFKFAKRKIGVFKVFAKEMQKPNHQNNAICDLTPCESHHPHLNFDYHGLIGINDYTNL
jgi:hypothetical protein